ncbi:acid protease [Meredithblackwellia eburnea MCA 4105]
MVLTSSLLSLSVTSLVAVASGQQIFSIPLQRRAVVVTPPEGQSTGKRALSYESLGTATESYFAQIEIGTPPVSYLTLLDTGSSDLVVETAIQNDSCSGCAVSGPLYDPRRSSTANITTIPVSIEYSIGFDSGVLVNDVVQVGDFLKNQTLAACDRNSLFSTVGSSTSLLGLAWQSLAQTNSTPFIQDLWQKGQLTNPVFGLGFADGSAARTKQGLISGGYLTVGDLNTTLYDGNLTWYPLAQYTDGTYTGYWDTALDAIYVNGQSTGYGSKAAVIDSGTNGIVVPTVLFTAIWQLIPGAYFDNTAQRYFYPCSSSSSGVLLTFVFGGTPYTLRPQDFESVRYTDGTCSGSVRNGGENSRIVIGAPFFESFYCGFRFDPPAVGFAALKTLGSNAIPSVVSQAPSTTGVITPLRTASGGSTPRATGTSTATSASAPPVTASSWKGVSVLVSLLLVFATPLFLF